MTGTALLCSLGDASLAPPVVGRGAASYLDPEGPAGHLLQPCVLSHPRTEAPGYCVCWGFGGGPGSGVDAAVQGFGGAARRWARPRTRSRRVSCHAVSRNPGTPHPTLAGSSSLTPRLGDGVPLLSLSSPTPRPASGPPWTRTSASPGPASPGPPGPGLCGWNPGASLPGGAGRTDALPTPDLSAQADRGARASTLRCAGGGAAARPLGGVTSPGLHSPSWGVLSPGSRRCRARRRGGGAQAAQLWLSVTHTGKPAFQMTFCLGLGGAPGTPTVPPLLLLCPAPLFPSRILGEWPPLREHSGADCTWFTCGWVATGRRGRARLPSLPPRDAGSQSSLLVYAARFSAQRQL